MTDRVFDSKDREKMTKKFSPDEDRAGFYFALQEETNSKSRFKIII
jgi:hypothetical protein